MPSPFWVDIDNGGSAEKAVRYLIEKGHRRIATVTGPLDMYAGVERLRGYQRVMAEAGVEIEDRLVVQGDFSVEGGAEAMARLLDQGGDPDAVFVGSDMMAVGAIRTLRERGLRVPEDIALVGFDNTLMAEHSDPALTTVHQPTVKMGQEMARLLVDVAIPRTAESEMVLLDTHLVVRDSA